MEDDLKVSDSPSMKILFVMDSLKIGGAEKSTLEIAKHLPSAKALLCHIYRGNQIGHPYEQNGIRILSFELPGTYQLFRSIQLLRRLIRTEKPDIVVATLLRSELIARVTCRIEKVPLVGTFVNDTYAAINGRFSVKKLPWKKQFFKILDQLSARWCIGFLANSESIKRTNAAALGIPLDKIEVIHRGRDLDEFFGEPERKPRLSDEILFVCVGRLIERKGHSELLEAFAKFHMTYPKSRLLIAGEGPYRAILEDRCRQWQLNDVVSLSGEVTDVPALLRMADCFIFPSHYEGFSGALVEAALAGLPILASDIPMNREVLPEDSAIFFPAKQADEILRAMHAFVNDRMGAMKRAKLASQFARKNFDIRIIAAQHEAFYRRMKSKYYSKSTKSKVGFDAND